MKQLSAEGNEEWVVAVDVRGKLYYRTGNIKSFLSSITTYMYVS